MSTPQGETVIGTAGGATLTTIISAMKGLPLGDIILSALIGTVISFLVTEGLKWLKSKFINRNGKIN